MFESIEAIREARIFNLRIFRSGVSTFRDFEVLEVDAFQDGALDQKSKEPIALGISICVTAATAVSSITSAGHPVLVPAGGRSARRPPWLWHLAAAWSNGL